MQEQTKKDLFGLDEAKRERCERVASWQLGSANHSGPLGGEISVTLSSLTYGD